MKVAILVTVHGSGTGAYRVLDHLLENWDREDPDLVVVAPRDSSAFHQASRSGILTEEFPTSRDAWIENLRALWQRRGPAGSYDLVHAWHSRAFDLGALLGSVMGLRFTATLHDHPVQTSHSLRRKRLMRWSLKRAEALVAVSRTLAEAWRPLLPRSAALAVIHNGVPMVTVVREPSAGDRMRVGFTGLYSPMKGAEIVADWIENLQDECPVEWLLFGDLHPAVHALLRQRGTLRRPNVALLGPRRRDAIFSVIDILVHPSTEFDSLPTVLIEAASAGIPVVAAGVGGVPEIVVDGETGFLFDPAYPEQGLMRLRHLLHDAGLRRRMGGAARALFCQRFRVENMVESYARFWTGVLHDGRQRPAR
ncbi:MAG TPA: glycosyltransferase [Kiritimatiellae bacterium]|nr:glycosyltransferase [Kiritimatiellia bacterium]